MSLVVTKIIESYWENTKDKSVLYSPDYILGSDIQTIVDAMFVTLLQNIVSNFTINLDN